MIEQLTWGGAREMGRRSLRIFPFDPMVDRFSDPVVCKVPYEVLTPGPVGRPPQSGLADAWLPLHDQRCLLYRRR